jgi:hypothetical protein
MLTITITYTPVSSQDREDIIEDIKAVCEEYDAEMETE